MREMKKPLVAVVAFLAVALLSLPAQAEKKIGVLMFSEEARYLAALKGIKERLGEKGFGEKNAAFIIENADANKAKAAELVQKFTAAKLDLIITLGTSVTSAMSQEIHDVPIVFCMVYDPVDAGIAKALKSSGNNTTGTSTKIAMSRLVESLRTFGQVGRLAVLYTAGEKNSELQLIDLQQIQKNHTLKVIPVRLTRSEDINQLVPEVLRTADALYITGSHLVDRQISVIANMATKAKVVTITHLDDLVEKGVLLGTCINSYAGGQLAGEKAVKILKGAKPSSIPIQTPKEYDVLLNMRTAKEGNFQIPPDFMRTVTKKIE